MPMGQYSHNLNNNQMAIYNKNNLLKIKMLLDLTIKMGTRTILLEMVRPIIFRMERRTGLRHIKQLI